MATCKHSVTVGKGGRYTRRCDESATEAVVFTSVLDDGFKIQTQMPICKDHLNEKVAFLKLMETPYYIQKLP